MSVTLKYNQNFTSIGYGDGFIGSLTSSVYGKYIQFNLQPSSIIQSISFTITNKSSDQNFGNQSFYIGFRPYTTNGPESASTWERNNNILFSYRGTIQTPPPQQSQTFTFSQLNINIPYNSSSHWMGGFINKNENSFNSSEIAKQLYSSNYLTLDDIQIEMLKPILLSFSDDKIFSPSATPYFYNIACKMLNLSNRSQFFIKTAQNTIQNIEEIKIKTGNNTFYTVPKLPQFTYNSTSTEDHKKLYGFTPTATFQGYIATTNSNDNNNIKYLIFDENNLELNNNQFYSFSTQNSQYFYKDHTYYLLIFNLNDNDEFTIVSNAIIDIIPKSF